MQLEQDIAYLTRLADATDSETALVVQRIILSLDTIHTSVDSSEQTERLEEAARRLRELKGLDPEVHNEICLMAERFEQAETVLFKLFDAAGY